ncbi:hypothetical protein [Actinophytocola algeriensis]|uniref:Uncharacterized protein n=1 Tax=Actinophytocola algeriensis TaxID=1768010 RepID=A0A7W7Q6S3_9PSEU|nr:hypothetical protein [Actinophytocola algeriensis]MBB4908117.1 hypothetical protein [Actinophytocola algeriensis]MBE1480147.1 hypothetical protein [Actinophytocola algeriensis]
MTYPPQQGQPYGGYPGQAGPYGQPPKNRAPVIATMIFLVAVLAGVGVLGFVAPGFFLGDDDKSSGGGSASDDSGGSGPGGGPGGLPGGDSGGGVSDGPDTPGESDDSGGDGPGADSDGPADGPGSGSSSGDGDSEAAAFAEEFVSAVNAKDAATANGMYCPGAAKGIVDYAVAKDPKLAIDSTETSSVFYTVMLTGTLEGRPLRRGKITVELKGSNAPCVFTFSAG